jgi:two-component system response regulator YesN
MYKVIVIDDEMLVRRGIVMETDWQVLNCVVVAEAGNGIEGLEAVRKYHPDLLICDIRMPKMDGIEMLKELRAEGNDVSVIFLTAYSEFSYAQSALKLLASDYLLKPFGDGELEQAVNNALEKRKRTQEKLENSKDEPLPELVLNKGDKSKYVMAAVDYISVHYGDPELCVAEIAEHLGISEGHLSHTFKRETDYTVAAYITRVRMRTAMKLLNDCRNKVYEVAEQVGYRDVAHFSSSFKRIVGVTPSEYQDRSM